MVVVVVVVVEVDVVVVVVVVAVVVVVVRTVVAVAVVEDDMTMEVEEGVWASLHGFNTRSPTTDIDKGAASRWLARRQTVQTLTMTSQVSSLHPG